MKNLLLLITLLFATSAYAQVTHDNGVCSQPIEGGTVAYGCTFTPDPVEPPPPPPPPSAPYTKLVCIGDSWTDDAGGASDRRHPKWCTKLAEQYGIPRDLVAVRGWTTSQILGLVTTYLNANGADPDALYAYWIFPNDFRMGPLTPAGWFAALPGIEANVAETFNRIKQAGGQHFLLLNFPDASLLPETGGVSAVNVFSDALNQAYINALAAANESAAYYNINPLFLNHSGPVYVQSDGRHPTEAVHQAVADQLFVFLGQ